MTWRPELPPAETIQWLGPLIMLVITGFGYLAGTLRVRKKWRSGDTRKIFHFAIFTTAATLQATVGFAGVNLLGGLFAFYLFTLLRVGEGNVFYEGIARKSDAPHRSLHIFLPALSTGVGGVLSGWLFGDCALIGFLASGCGDAVAEPIGSRFGKHRYKVPSIGVPSERSYEGSAAVFVASALGIATALWLVPTLGATGPQIATVALACAAASTVVEAISHHGLDNLTVQVAAAGVAAALL
ncbi:MAG: hypothetical protein AAF517_08045 [Planctomycetota bacterium]